MSFRPYIGPSVTPLFHAKVSPTVMALTSSFRLRARRASVDTTVHRFSHPGHQLVALSLPDHSPKGLAQRIRLRHACMHLAQLVQICMRFA
jgi:hypothetical protein